MKALIREEDETVTEDMGIPGINWTTGYPLTARGWAGGSYVLVNDYVRRDPAVDFDPTPARRKAKGAVQAPPAQAPAATPSAQDPAEATVQDTIIIDGVKYIRTS